MSTHNDCPRCGSNNWKERDGLTYCSKCKFWYEGYGEFRPPLLKVKSWERLIRRNLVKARHHKNNHKNSKQCTRKSGDSCSACHFYSGSISALSELLGQPGIID